MGTLDHVKDLIAMVADGKFVEAIERFYAEDATMQENQGTVRSGLQTLVENERNVLRVVPDIRLETVGSYVVDGDRAAINWIFRYTDPRGRQIRLDELAYQEWHDGKIVRERFYYDPAQRERSV